MKATTGINVASMTCYEGITDCFGGPHDHAFPVCDAVEGNPKADGSAAQMNCHLSPSQTLAQSDPSGNRHAIVTTEL